MRCRGPLSALIAGGAFVLYVVSRPFGLLGLPEGEREWLDPKGVLSMSVVAESIHCIRGSLEEILARVQAAPSG